MDRHRSPSAPRITSYNVCYTKLLRDDVEAVFARIAVGRPAERDDDVAQRAVVHVDHAPPLDAPHVDAERVALRDVVVDQGRQQVVGERDGRSYNFV